MKNVKKFKKYLRSNDLEMDYLEELGMCSFFRESEINEETKLFLAIDFHNEGERVDFVVNNIAKTNESIETTKITNFLNDLNLESLGVKYVFIKNDIIAINSIILGTIDVKAELIAQISIQTVAFVKRDYSKIKSKIKELEEELKTNKKSIVETKALPDDDFDWIDDILRGN